MPAGLKTTELWLAVATDIGVIAASLADALPAKWAAVAAAVSSAAYALARGLAKNGGTTVTTPPAPVTVTVTPTPPTV